MPRVRVVKDKRAADGGAKKRRMQQYLLFLAFIAPNFLLLGVFTYWPMIYQVHLSLTRCNMLMQSYFRENPNFKVAVHQLPRTQPQDTVRTLTPNGDNTIGIRLERIFVSNEPAESVFQEIAQQLETDAQDVKEQAAGRV